jgi:transcriptional regulator with XRE-family HTH domain
MNEHPRLSPQEVADRDRWYQGREDARKRAGRMLRTAREGKGLAVADVAGALKRAAGTVQSWECGYLPGRAARAGLCALLGIDRATLEALYAANEGPPPVLAPAASRPSAEGSPFRKHIENERALGRPSAEPSEAAEPDAPEAPPVYNNAEASAWQCGWTSGYAAALSARPAAGPEPTPEQRATFEEVGAAMREAGFPAAGSETRTEAVERPRTFYACGHWTPGDEASNPPTCPVCASSGFQKDYLDSLASVPPSPDATTK